MNAKFRNWVFVKIETDEPGIVGWGEASTEWNTQAVVGALADLAPLIVGEDPSRIEHLWQRMFRHHFFKGGFTAMSAISGVDQALYDIKGKLLGVPIFELLGGRVRDRVRLYDHLGAGETSVVYADPDPAAFAERALESVSRGYDALKFLPVAPGRQLETRAAVRRAARVVESVRTAVGDEVDIMIDLHGRTLPAMTIRYGAAFEEFDPLFLEEPCQPENVDALREIAAKLRIPIATGERHVTRHEFRRIFELRAAAVVQPDICHCGGVTELKKIAAMAESYYITVAPHNPLGPIATAHNIHVAFSTPNHLIQEVMRADVPWRDEVVVGDLLPASGGYALPPREPGLGVRVDEEAAARRPFALEPQVISIDDVGAVNDW